MKQDTNLRADAQQTRRRLIEVGLEQFGRLGFGAASTRALATAAEANLGAIKYHFDGKEGLYLAVAEHIAEQMHTALSPMIEAVQTQLSSASPAGAISAETARATLRKIASGMVQLIAANPQTVLWMRFILREQAEPTQAFEIVYAKVMQPMHMLLSTLVAAITGDVPESDAAKLKAFALIGQIIFFRVAHAAVVRRMGWQTIGAAEAEEIEMALHLIIDGLPPTFAQRETR